ncbi:MAG: tetratricopeptide repeat protein [Deltaproteobacteria bacterium]|nr:tetratricopeptide repeat protein [Deltaproteobacteria bacterium]
MTLQSRDGARHPHPARLPATAALLVLLALLPLRSAPGQPQAPSAFERARSALARSDYPQAEQLLGEAAAGPQRGAALLLRARLELWTGRYAQAEQSAREAARATKPLAVEAAPWLGEALARQGKRDEAIAALEQVAPAPEARRARLVLGELLIAAGRRADAEQQLMTIIQEYNSDVIGSTDAEGLSLVGRAAHLLRAYQDANDAFNQAERAGARRRVETLLWRAELFLEKYDPGHAAAVVREALALAPHDPRAHVAMAEVGLAQAMDFAAAEKEIDVALKVDPNLASAYFVRAGLALRTMDLAAAEAAANAGLKIDPGSLELLSIKAAARFLGDDQSAFASLQKQVLQANPQYSRFFRIVGEFAEWEHRYDEIVALMREAVGIDPADALAYAALGLNLIRAGDEPAGIEELRKAWRRDPFGVRVFNTLNLYEKTIATDYVTRQGTTFRIRYPKKDQPILQRYVPALLEQAWASLVKRYGFTPSLPVGIELYADEQSFSVRTSGLPNVGIQGVCFGRTLAALSPSAAPFNWGMILWHELAHVFAIQLSRSRVPRWLTEGLSEYETLIRRPEWKREDELALFLGLRENRIPTVAGFNRAFTHAGSVEDVTMAYYAASQIAVFVAEKYGPDKMVAMLPKWAAGLRTAEVIEQTLGISADELDRQFRAFIEPRLARYRKQFVPLAAAASVDEARARLAQEPKSAKRHVELALALLGEGKEGEAVSLLQLALGLDPQEPDALFLKLRLAMKARRAGEARQLVGQLVAGGHDGYAVRMRAADLAETERRDEQQREHLLAAHRLDPSQTEPLQALYDLAHKSNDAGAELAALRPLAQLDQHDRRVWRRLLGRLVEHGLWEEARRVGEGAIYVDATSPEIHYLYGRALAHTGRFVSAIFELNSAIIAGAKPPRAARIYRSLAAGYRKLGRQDYADKAEGYARQMEERVRSAPAGGEAASP